MAGADKPNILVIWGDDIGLTNLSCYGDGVMGYRTPNIDRIAAEGMRFTDAYAGCTLCAPSRSTLMTGKHMGHTTVRSNGGGVPILASDVTVQQMLKTAGYATGCFGSANTMIALPPVGRLISGLRRSGIAVPQLAAPTPTGIATYCRPSTA